MLTAMALLVDGLVKRFGPVVALDGMDFRAEPGEIFGFLGANGSGKTTTIRIVLDLLRPDAGSTSWQGIPTAELPRRTWGYLPEERGLYGRMAVLDQLVFFAGLYGVERVDAQRIAREWLERLRIPDAASRRTDELSKGNQQKVQFIAAIVHDPDVLIMDEPFVGLDPVNTSILRAAFLELRERGKTLIFSTHQMETVEALCESIVIVDRGRVVIGGPVREVRRSSGRQVVRIALDGEGRADGPDRLGWLSSFPGVRLSRPGADYAELTVPRDLDPEAILRAALERGERVTRFEIADPSLEEIFIELVGRPVSEDAELAPAAGATLAPGAGPRSRPPGAHTPPTPPGPPG
jgi:ABC-2 type transport system ATP-binding protein